MKIKFVNLLTICRWIDAQLNYHQYEWSMQYVLNYAHIKYCSALLHYPFTGTIALYHLCSMVQVKIQILHMSIKLNFLQKHQTVIMPLPVHERPVYGNLHSQIVLSWHKLCIHGNLKILPPEWNRTGGWLEGRVTANQFIKNRRLH